MPLQRNDSDLSESHTSQTLKALSLKLGYDYTKLEKEGGRLWETLNDLRANDPRAYDEFIFQQLQRMQSSEGGDGLFNSQTASSLVPPFVPLHGFVVKTYIQPDGTKLFVNICHHGTAVPKPIDANGDPIMGSCRNFENLQIPFLISKTRECLDANQTKAIVVDVVVNSWCIDVCQKDASPEFKAQLVILVAKWLEKEHSFRIHARGQLPWKIIRSKYKGGFGKDGLKVRPFEHQIKYGNQYGSKKISNTSEDKLGKITESPSDLIKYKKKRSKESNAKEQVLDLTLADKTNGKNPSLIQEISNQKLKAGATNQLKRAPSIKSGF